MAQLWLGDRIRNLMFNAALRQLAKTAHLHFPWLPWCRREERGELLGRRHSKCLRGENAYETSKFAEGLSHLTLSAVSIRLNP